jgi:ElaA protein
MQLLWSWSRFDELSLDGLYDALALRCRVFVLEQGPYLDPDGLDRAAWHLLGRDGDGVLQAYLRAVDPERRFAEPSIGRVVVAPESRGQGQGRALVTQGLTRAGEVWPGRPLRISAQSHLQRFYRTFGFVPSGVEHLEDGIPHIEMLREGVRR